MFVIKLNAVFLLETVDAAAGIQELLHAEQTSTRRVDLIEPVSNVLPQAQVAVTTWYVG